MSRRMLSLAIGLALTLIPMASAAEQNYGAILQALPDPVPIATSPGCLIDGAGLAKAADAALLAQYARPFDDEAGKAVLGYLASAIAAVPSSGVKAPGPASFDGQTPTQAFSQGYSSLGLDPANALDVAALYLVVAWAAQNGDISVLGSLNADQLAAVKAQVLGGDLRCAFLFGAQNDLPRLRNQMIALTGLLFDGIESHSRSGTLDNLAEEARKLFGDQIGGLTLTARGFSTP